MNLNIRSLILYAFFTLFNVHVLGQNVIPITVKADHSAARIQPTMWGLFFEDINFAADGGIYAELVKNRSFEFPDPMEGWGVEGASFFRSPVQIVNREKENPNNPRTARIVVDETVCILNSGFRGMGIHENESYRFSILSSVLNGDMMVRVSLVGQQGEELGEELGNTVIQFTGESWQSYQAELKATKTEAKAALKLCFEGDGTIEIDMISLFPVNTWKRRVNGLRADLVQKLADLDPGFLRFPGGCIVEGRDLSKRYQWKNSIGELNNRKVIINRWNDENSRATPDYFQTFGLGFYEYFLLSEDLGAEPVPILNCGMACQFNTGEVVALEDMEPYLQDALDLIEFANGPVDSRWGSIRAGMGHPESFHMKYLGIGNEQWGAQYFERYALFEKMLAEQHPEIMLISSTGPMAGGPLFEFNANALKEFSPALVDEHYYNSPEWFFNNTTRYDQYDRNTYKIFAGEYAAANVRMASPENRNVWLTALSEAAFMTGLERNADVVHMASYAPLLAHTEAWQWTPDLIWFDNLSSYGTPNYYVQKLFSTHSGTDLLEIERQGEPLTGQDGLYASAVWEENSQEIIVKIVSNNEKPVPVSITIDTEKNLSQSVSASVLQCDDLNAMNSIENPEHIVPVQKSIEMSQNEISLELEGYSVTVLKIKQD